MRFSTLGIAIGLGIRTTYNPDSTTASIVSGTLDSMSAGVLLYTGLVEVRLVLLPLGAARS
jgi:zinc transporter 1/2/3